MSTLPPHDVAAIFWIDGASQQQGPESLATVIERIAHDQIPASTPVWWQGAVNWSPFNSNAELAAALDARLAPAPAPQPTYEQPAYEQPAYEQPVYEASPFSTPAPSESASPFQAPAAVFESPAVFQSPQVFETPAAAYEAPVSYETPAATYEAPVSYEAPAATYEAPAATYEAPVSYEAPAATYDPSATQVMDAPFATAPVVTDVPEIILPDTSAPVPEPVAEEPSTGLDLGDPAELASTFAALTARSDEFNAEAARAAALDDTLATMVRQSIDDLGFTVLETIPSDDYHSYRLAEPDGSTAALAVQRVPAAISVAAATERPLACFVDRSDRASVGLFLGDYLGDDGSTDQALFSSHLASVVDAAGAA